VAFIALVIANQSDFLVIESNSNILAFDKKVQSGKTPQGGFPGSVFISEFI
jgi:hypothetical protein